MANNPKTLHTEGDEASEFTSDQWLIDFQEYLYGAESDTTPRQPDEWTVKDAAGARGMSIEGARHLLDRGVRSGKLAVRKASIGGSVINLYRSVRDE